MTLDFACGLSSMLTCSMLLTSCHGDSCCAAVRFCCCPATQYQRNAVVRKWFGCPFSSCAWYRMGPYHVQPLLCSSAGMLSFERDVSVFIWSPSTCPYKFTFATTIGVENGKYAFLSILAIFNMLYKSVFIFPVAFLSSILYAPRTPQFLPYFYDFCHTYTFVVSFTRGFDFTS